MKKQNGITTTTLIIVIVLVICVIGVIIFNSLNNKNKSTVKSKEIYNAEEIIATMEQLLEEEIRISSDKSETDTGTSEEDVYDKEIIGELEESVEYTNPGSEIEIVGGKIYVLETREEAKHKNRELRDSKNKVIVKKNIVLEINDTKYEEKYTEAFREAVK